MSPSETTPVMSTASSFSQDRGLSRASATLITGAGGEVGHGLLTAMHDAGRQNVVAIDLRELDPQLRALCREVFVGDICEAPLLQRLQSMFEITEIYHLAALLSTRVEFAPEAGHEVNVGGTLNLLRLAAASPSSSCFPARSPPTAWATWTRRNAPGP